MLFEMIILYVKLYVWSYQSVFVAVYSWISGGAAAAVQQIFGQRGWVDLPRSSGGDENKVFKQPEPT